MATAAQTQANATLPSEFYLIDIRFVSILDDELTIVVGRMS
jgi:hypothetical protein